MRSVYRLNASIFEETTIAVPETPYGFKNKSPVNSDSENTHSESTPNSPNEHEYLAPGFPYVSRNEAENRFRKISSPARMKFFQPDKETVAKFNARWVVLYLHSQDCARKRPNEWTLECAELFAGNFPRSGSRSFYDAGLLPIQNRQLSSLQDVRSSR